MAILRRSKKRRIKGFHLTQADIDRLEHLWRLARKEFPTKEYGAVRYSEIICACLALAARVVEQKGIRQLFR